MEREIRLPVLGDNISSSEVVKVIVKEGDKIEKGQPLAEFSSDKATIELPSDFDGIVKKVLVKQGDNVNVDDLLFIIESVDDNEIEEKKEENNIIINKQEENTIQEKIENSEKEIRLPVLGDNISSSEVVKVIVKEGDKIEKGQPLAEFSSDKATIELPSDFDGIVKKVLVKQGDNVKIDDLLFIIQSINASNVSKNETYTLENKTIEKEEFSIIQEEKKHIQQDNKKLDLELQTSNKIIPASPSVRRFAREIGIDITKVKGSQKNGRITIEDVKNYSRELNKNRVQNINDKQKYIELLPDFSKWGNIQKEKMNNIRYKTAQHLSFAWNVIPHVTQFIKVDITEIEKLRKKYSLQIEKNGAKLTITAILTKFVTYVLKKYPKFNCSIDLENKEIIYKDYYNIGIAVDTPKGLLVPVIKNADNKNLTDISIELKELSNKAKESKLTLEDMQGATFTITNLGGIEGDYFTPIVNYPEVAILGVSKSKIEPVYINENFEPRLMMPLSLSYDHRIIDGADAARFLKLLKEVLEDPFLLFI